MFSFRSSGCSITESCCKKTKTKQYQIADKRNRCVTQSLCSWHLSWALSGWEKAPKLTPVCQVIPFDIPAYVFLQGPCAMQCHLLDCMGYPSMDQLYVDMSGMLCSVKIPWKPPPPSLQPGRASCHLQRNAQITAGPKQNLLIPGRQSAQRIPILLSHIYFYNIFRNATSLKQEDFAPCRAETVFSTGMSSLPSQTLWIISFWGVCFHSLSAAQWKKRPQ